MLKYKLKKDVLIEPNMAFKYKSLEELVALLYALGEPATIAVNAKNSGTSLKESGLLILSWVQRTYSNTQDHFDRKYIVRKYLIGSHEHVVKKKDFFDKTEYDDSPTGENKKVPTHHDNINSTVISKGLICGNFEGRTGYRMGSGANSTNFIKQQDINDNKIDTGSTEKVTTNQEDRIPNKSYGVFMKHCEDASSFLENITGKANNIDFKKINLGGDLGNAIIISRSEIDKVNKVRSFFDMLSKLKTIVSEDENKQVGFKRESYLFPQIDPKTGKPMHCVYVFKKFFDDGNIEVVIKDVIDEERKEFESMYSFLINDRIWIHKKDKQRFFEREIDELIIKIKSGGFGDTEKVYVSILNGLSEMPIHKNECLKK